MLVRPIVCVLGPVSSFPSLASVHLQTVDEIEALAAEGIEQVGVARVALNPDCGFAPDAGEPPTIDEAFEKLRRLSVAAARLRQRFCGAKPNS